MESILSAGLEALIHKYQKKAVKKGLLIFSQPFLHGPREFPSFPFCVIL